MTPLYYIPIVLIGLVAGSFLNVVIYRLPREKSVIRPRSACPSCRAPILWYENIPVLSYIILRGRCRSCRNRISARYPVVEILGGALAAVSFYQRRRYGFEFAAATVGRDGEVLFGEHDHLGHLWIYFPRVEPRLRPPAGPGPA